MANAGGARSRADIPPPLMAQAKTLEHEMKRLLKDWEAEVAKYGSPTDGLAQSMCKSLKDVMSLMDTILALPVSNADRGANDCKAPQWSSGSGFPRVWQLFPFLLPPSVRERIYEPAHEELKEDYLRARAICAGRYSRAWVAFCFTIRTAGLFAGSLWAAVGGTARKVFIAAVALLFGEHAVAAVRAKVAEWWGRLL